MVNEDIMDLEVNVDEKESSKIGNRTAKNIYLRTNAMLILLEI